MPLTNYSYIQTDFPGQKVNPNRLKDEISASAIVTALERIDTSAGSEPTPGFYNDGVLSGTFTVNIWFKDALSVSDKTILDNDTTNPAGGLIAAHNNAPTHITEVIAPQTTTTNEIINGYIATAATTSVTIRATAYTPQGTNAQRSISSTSANDTSAGTGARTIKITYLDAAANGPFTETITLNGVTAVDTVNTNIALIEKMEVVTVGAGGGNAGTIRIHTATVGGGSIWGSIAISDNRTYWAHHYVPTTKVVYVTLLFASASTVAGILTLNVLNPLDTAIVQFNPAGSLRYGTTTNNLSFNVPFKIAGPAILFLNSRPDTTTSSTSFGGFGYIQF